MAVAQVNIQGLRELRSALRQVDRSILTELREDFKTAGNEIAREISVAVPKVTGRAAASIRAVSRGNTVYIVGGKARVPYYGWLEFGGQLPQKRPSSKRALMWSGAYHPSASAAGAYREKVTEGRYLYPGVRRNIPKLVDAAGDAFDNAARRAGLL